MPIPGSITDGLMDKEEVIRQIGEFGYPSRVTFKKRGTVIATTGQENVTYTIMDERHQNVPCRLAPLVLARPRDAVVQAQIISQDVDSHLTCWGDFGDVQDNDRAVVDDVPYRIVGVERDGNHITTRMYLSNKGPFND